MKGLGKGILITCAKFQGLSSQKRRGHWTLTEFGVLCLNQPVLSSHSVSFVHACMHARPYNLFYFFPSSLMVSYVVVTPKVSVCLSVPLYPIILQSNERSNQSALHENLPPKLDQATARYHSHPHSRIIPRTGILQHVWDLGPLFGRTHA